MDYFYDGKVYIPVTGVSKLSVVLLVNELTYFGFGLAADEDGCRKQGLRCVDRGVLSCNLIKLIKVERLVYYIIVGGCMRCRCDITLIIQLATRLYTIVVR